MPNVFKSCWMPANIFAARRGGKWDVAKLLDFGLVQETTPGTNGEGGQDSVRTTVSGSPLYMSPEQVAASGPLDARTDIYSLGATAYYLLTSKPPFAAKSAQEVMKAHVMEHVVPPSELNPSLPPDLEDIVLCCLEKDAADRFASVDEIERAIAQCACANLWTDQAAAQWWSGADVASSGDVL